MNKKLKEKIYFEETRKMICSICLKSNKVIIIICAKLIILAV